MPVSLDEIVAATRRRVSETKPATDLRQLDRQAGSHVPRGFRRSLESGNGSGMAVIAELKRASPSRGLIRSDFDPALLARELESAGAVALSVLTDEEFFQGSLENLRRASAATKLPCLRKDFIIDEFQLQEARANGADAVLLIVAALPTSELTTLARRAYEYDLDVLCEVHDEEELQRAVDAGCTLIGVNNRNLRTFQVDLETAVRLADLIPKNAFTVAESGIHSGADMARLRAAGYRAFLIGESLMKAKSPGAALKTLLAEALRESKAVART
ncbi:MAG TPA: indole-3-glycerol phosphate synthase TrpC [Terriglobales bacterium]|jgi:indole-3-glycerol phosphate synthase|nr:indole-3-glycerol phosphate synthase TrpC [Terriglobales bacterium]